MIMKLLKFLRSSMIVLFLVYVFFLLILAYFQKSFIFVPQSNHSPLEYAEFPGFKMINIETEDHEKLVAWYRPPKTEEGKVILLFHGNGGNLSFETWLIKGLMPLSDGFLAVDYRGYGGSTGTPSSQGLFKDADAAYSFLTKEGIVPERIIIAGHSLGSGIAVYTAQNKKISSVILLSAYSSLEDIICDRFPFYPRRAIQLLFTNNIDTQSMVKNVSVPIVIVHGDYDGIIPIKHAEKLFTQIAAPKHFIVLENMAHYLPLYEKTREEIKSFLEPFMQR